MKRLTPLALLSLAFAFPTFAGGDKSSGAKEALQQLQEFIGGWKGNGSSEKDRSAIWKETASWSWRFKGKEVFFSVEMDTSKFFKKGELKYVADKDEFRLSLVDVKGKPQVFDGDFKKGYLTLERTDEDAKEVQQIKMNTAGGGLRLILTYSTRGIDRKFFNKQFQVAYTKEGESFGSSGAKKPECCVTGGLGTTPVSFDGVTYYVCCSGCRDAFNENPAKVVAEYKAKKKKGG